MISSILVMAALLLELTLPVPDRLEKSDQGALDKWFEKVSKLPKKEKVEVDDAADGATRPPLQGTLFASAFKERDEVQALGAKWDQRANSFYVPFGSDATPFAKWLGAGADASGAIAAHNAVPRVAPVGIVRNPSLGKAKDAKVQAERPSIEPEDLAKMSAGALKEELSARGLDASGKKADLVAKLQAALDTGGERLHTVASPAARLLHTVASPHTHTHTHTHAHTHTHI
jgi:hypothetical protein